MDARVCEFGSGRFRLELLQRRLLIDGVPAKLGARAFDVLLALIERHHRMVSKDELMQLVWPNLVVEENNLQVQIAALRKLLGAQSIVTVPGRGYKFALPIEDPATRPAPPAPRSAVAGEDAIDAATIPATVFRPPRLIARDGVLRAMELAWASGHVLIVAGEAGIGKTRLLSEFAAAHAPSIHVAARPGDAAVPFSSLIRLLTAAVESFAPPLDATTAHDCARLLPQLDAASDRLPPLASDVQRLRFLGSLGRLLHACHVQGCRAFVFDDVQFADPATIEALRVIADPADPGAPRFVFGTRIEDLPLPASGFFASLAATRRAARVELAPLSTRDVEQLLASLDIPGLDAAAMSQRLQHHVGGNPAFLLETIKTLLAGGRTALADEDEIPVPPTLLSTVQQRLSQLSADALNLAQLAAVAGPDFSLRLAASALDRAPLAVAPTLAELERLQILRGATFAHDLVQEAVRRSTPEPIAVLLHGLVAEHLQAQGGDPARVAAHLLAAGNETAAAPHLAAAAEQASARWQLPEAAAGFERAAHIFEAAGDRARAFAAQMSACRCFGTLHQSDGELRTIEAARRLASAPAERLLVQEVEVRSAYNRSAGERMTAAAQLLGGQIRAALDVVAAHDLAQRLPNLAIGLTSVGDALVLELCDAIESRLDPADRRAALAVADARGTAQMWYGSSLEAEANRRRMLQLAREVDDAVAEVRAARDLGIVLALQGKHDAAVAQWDEALARTSRSGLGLHWRVETLSFKSWSLLALGRFGEALAALCTEFDDGPYELMRCNSALPLAETWRQLGRIEHAAQTLAAVEPSSIRHSPNAIRWWTAALRLAHRRGESSAARWRSVWETWQGHPDGWHALQFRAMRARCEDSDHAYDDAVQVAAICADRALLSIRRSAELAAALRSLPHAPQRAAAHARAALALWHCADIWTGETADVWHVGYQALAAAGARDEARACLRTGVEWVERAVRDHVPAEHRRSFVEDNAVNRGLLDAARREFG